MDTSHSRRSVLLYQCMPTCRNATRPACVYIQVLATRSRSNYVRFETFCLSLLHSVSPLLSFHFIHKHKSTAVSQSAQRTVNARVPRTDRVCDVWSLLFCSLGGHCGWPLQLVRYVSSTSRQADRKKETQDKVCLRFFSRFLFHLLWLGWATALDPGFRQPIKNICV